MKQITLNIPDSELSFFMKLIEKFNYETVVNDISITQQMKDVLDERKETSKKEDFIPWEEVKKKISFKTK
ncbi:hypothetical protein ACFO3U_13450 [Flavobacterium ponti]|uniref:Addiction module component n=1 Tax=Flavobacterium ponti TaxID=665133 RepID=A0ABV9P5X7_9FLAO